jgi:D-alanyl-D-alanine carboxypeptidase (penicillin-binding protein 5/6)
LQQRVLLHRSYFSILSAAGCISERSMKRILPALRSLALFAAVAPAAFGALAQQAPQPPEIAAALTCWWM